MDNSFISKNQGDIYSQAVRAGKRTYFFDVKETKSKELYITITESIRRFSNEQSKFQYYKQKIYLYKEDFENFTDGLKEVLNFIENEQKNLVVNESDSEQKINDHSQ